MNKNYKIGIGFKIFTSLLLIFLTLIYISTAIYFVLQRQKFDGLRINLAGRQRMLTQKMSKEVLIYSIYGSKGIKVDDIKLTMQIFQMTLHSLRDGGKAPPNLNLKSFVNLPKMETKSIYDQLTTVLKLWEPFKKHLLNYLENKSDTDLQYIINNNVELLSEMNKAVGMMQKSSESHTKSIYIHIIISIIIGIIAFIINFIVIKRIVINLRNFGKIFQKGAKGDLTIISKVNSNDEISDISKSFNSFILNLKKMVINISNSSEKGKEIGETLFNLSQSISTASEEIGATMKNITNQTNSLNSDIENVSKSIDEISKFIEEVDEQILNQSKTVTSSSSAIEESIATINNLSSIASDRISLLDNLQNLIQVGEKNIKDTISGIQEVSESASIIINMLSLIADISDKTNLLAMNASIEAAHAGEAGHGFAVVAEEIRKLSEDTQKHTKNIEDKLKLVISKIDKTVSISNKTGESFSKIFKDIELVNKSMYEIINGLKEMSFGTDQLENSISELNQMTNIVKNSSKEMKIQALNIQKLISSVKEKSELNVSSISEADIAISEIVNIAIRLKNAGLENIENSKLLENEVKKFKIN